MTNPILDELHSVRQQLLAEAGGTLEGLVAKLQSDQQKSGRTIRKSHRTIEGDQPDAPDALAESRLLPTSDR